MITLNAPLTLRASYLPLPPSPQLLPLFSFLSLITVLVTPAHGIQGCFNTTSFDKNYWHFNFTINPLRSSFFLTASFPYIFRNTPCRKNAPLFSANHQSKIFSPAFSSAITFHSSLMNMPITYIKEIESTLLTLFGLILSFIEEKGR